VRSRPDPRVALPTSPYRYSVFDVYALIWGFILPKSINFRSMSYIKFQDLLESHDSLEALVDCRERLKNLSLDYKKKTEKSIRIIGEGIDILTNEYDEIKTSVAIQLDERTRISESLEEIKEIKARVESELGDANKKLALSEGKLKLTISNVVDSTDDLTQIKSDVVEGTNELNNILTKIELEQANLENGRLRLEKVNLK
jgi:ElaB/YqjD/DUF883 family membrane-anchored ribosome-binding protein